MAITNVDYKEPMKVTIQNVSDKPFTFQLYRANLWKTVGGVTEDYPDGQGLELTATSSEEAIYYDSLEKPTGVTITLDAISSEE